MPVIQRLGAGARSKAVSTSFGRRVTFSCLPKKSSHCAAGAARTAKPARRAQGRMPGVKEGHPTSVDLPRLRRYRHAGRAGLFDRASATAPALLYLGPPCPRLPWRKGTGVLPVPLRALSSRPARLPKGPGDGSLRIASFTGSQSWIARFRSWLHRRLMKNPSSSPSSIRSSVVVLAQVGACCCLMFATFRPTHHLFTLTAATAGLCCRFPHLIEHRHDRRIRQDQQRGVV